MRLRTVAVIAVMGRDKARNVRKVSSLDPYDNHVN